MMALVPSLIAYEPNASRGSARAPELLRRLAHCMVDLFPVYHVADSAGVAAGDFVFCPGVPCRNGPEPNRSVAAQTPRPALRQRDTADARAYCFGYHDHRVCDSTVDHPDAGTVAERAQTRARPSNPNRIAYPKLPGSSRGIASH